MNQIKPVLAGSDEANFGSRFAQATLVGPVRTGKSFGRKALVIDQTSFLWNPVITQSDVQTIRRKRKVWRDKCLSIHSRVDDRSNLYRVLH